MSTNAAGNLPAAAPAVAPVVQPASTPGSLQPTPSRNDQPDPAFVAKLDAMKSSGDIMDFVESLKNTPAPKKAEQVPPAEVPPGKIPGEPPAAEPEPKPAEEPPAVPEGEQPPDEPATPAPGEEPAPVVEDEDPIPVGEGDAPAPITAAKARLTFRPDDKVGRLAARYMQRNRDMTMTEAVKAAEKDLGITPAAPVATRPAPKPDGMPDSVEGINAKITELKASRKEASTNLELDKYDQITEQLEALAEKRTMVVERGRQDAQEAVQAYERGFAASGAKASELYEFADKPESPGGKLMIEIDAALEANGDPLFNSPDKPLRLAQMAATRLNIPPKTKTPAVTAKPAPGPKVPAAQVQPKKDVIPGGASRTTPQTGQTLKPLDQAIQASEKDPKKLDEILAGMGIGV